MNIREKISSENIKIVKVLKSLGDENRFQIITLLLENNLCVGALARILNISKPAVSQHLKILRKAGLVRGEKIGYWTHYRVEKELLRESARYLQELIESQSDVLSKGNYICLREKRSNIDTERRVLQMCKNRCEQPDKLKTIPEECTPEQIKECHGDGKEHSCVSSCEQPDKLKTKPSECTPEQIKECHGESKKHPC